MEVCVVREPWRPQPLAWIHRWEARAIAAELRAAGHSVSTGGMRLLRVSDPVMLTMTRQLSRDSIPYLGPGAEVMERCYDKLEAWRVATANGIDTPATALATDGAAIAFPLILKPRRGCDSIGIRLLTQPPVPRRAELLVQQHIRGVEMTVGVLHGRTGMPLCIGLPPGKPYSFVRKYVARPPRSPLDDPALSALALKIADVFQVDWAARVDFIVEAGSGRAMFLECDVAPLIGTGSAFALSLAAGGMARPEQLRLLLRPRR